MHKVFAAAQAELSALNTCGVLRKLKIEFAAHRSAYCRFLRGTGRRARKRSFGLIAAIGRGAGESRSSIFCLRLFSFARFVRSDICRFPTLRFSSRGGSYLAPSASHLLLRAFCGAFAGGRPCLSSRLGRGAAAGGGVCVWACRKSGIVFCVFQNLSRAFRFFLASFLPESEQPFFCANWIF